MTKPKGALSHSKKAHFHWVGSEPPLKKICGAKNPDGTTPSDFVKSADQLHNGEPLQESFCMNCLASIRARRERDRGKE